ncbi:hypothetical protein ACR77M_21390 [Enterococcus avium]|uniref:hypothetical protein n=1 Tax=Enterococcus avium TaxID=33945 RepID=UPI003DA6657F
MANSKQAKFIVDVSAESKHTRKSSVRFFSYDSKTAEIVIQAEKDNELIPRGTISNVEIYFESVNSSYRPTESLKWNDQMTINDDGLFLYTLTDDLLNYQGLVAFEVYINYINNDKSDSSNRIIYEQRTSAIDRAPGEIEIVYIKDMETAKKEVADKAAEVKESLAGYDSGLDIYADQKKTEMDNFTQNVQETSINEITKIQNELPKVKQVNVDETKKIKAVYPIVEQVATTEKEKIRAVLSTVDQTASEVSAYADRKISEYDAKFTQSNQKMNDLQQSQTALTTKLTETQQKITDSDVFTKAESSVNVIDQVIGKEKALITLRADYSGKIFESLEENVNVAKRSSTGNGSPTRILSPNEFSTEVNQGGYDLIAQEDANVYNLQTYNDNGIMQVLFQYNVVEILERQLGEDFFKDRGATSLLQKTAVVREIITVINPAVWGYGSSETGNKLNYRVWINNSSWGGARSNNSSTVTKIEYSTTGSAANNYISDDGYLYAIAYTEPRTGSISSVLNIDYAALDITIELSAREHIEYMIAAYCRPLEQQINDLAQKVAAMENK